MSTMEEIARLGVELSLESDSFTKKISTVNKAIKNSEKEFNLAKKGAKDFDNSFVGLSATLDKNKKQLDLYNTKLEEQRKEFEKLEKDLEKAKNKLEEIEKVNGRGSKEWKAQAEIVKRNANAVYNLGIDIQKTEKAISTLNTEIAENTEKYNNLGKEVDTIESKFEELAKEIEAEQKEWDKLSQEIEESGKAFKNLDLTLNHMKNKMELSQKAVNILENEIGELSKKLVESTQKHSQLSKEIQRTETELNQAKSEFGENSQEVQQLSTKLNGLKDDYMRVGKEIDSTKTDLSQLNTELTDTKNDMQQLSNEIRQMPWDAMQKDLENTKQKYDDLADKTEGLTTKLAIVGGAGTAAFIQASDATSHFKGALGLTSEEAEKLTERAQELNYKGFDFSEAVEAITLVDQTMGELLKPDEIQGFTKDALSLAKTFNVDVNDVIKASTMMMKNFGIDGKQATDIITKGFQNGLDVSGDWIDTLWEYSVQFSDLGFSANDTFGIINKGMELGIFNTDKLADMVKESNIRLKEMGKAQVEGIKTLGLSTTKVQKNIAAGGETASKQMVEVAQKVLEIKDPVEQNAVAVALFGTMFEDIGIDGVKAIASIKDAQIDLKGSTDEMANALEESLGMQLRGKLAELKEPLINIGEAMLPIIDNAIELISKFSEWFSSLDQGTVEVLVGFGLLVSGISPVMKVLSNTTTVTQFLTSNMGKLGGEAISTGGNLGKFGSIASALSSAALPLLVLALVKIMDSMGDSEKTILSLQERFGGFGVFIGGLCEFISGVWDLTIGNIGIGATLIMDLIAAAIDGPGGMTVKEAWQKFNDDINQNHMDAMAKLSLNTTQGMSQLRNATDAELKNVTMIYDTVLGQIPNITGNKFDQAASSMATKLQGMSNTELTILQGMNDQTKWLFDGIKEGMNIDQITQQLIANFERGKLSGLNNTKSLAEGVKNGMDLTKQHMDTKTKEGAAKVDTNTKDAKNKADANTKQAANSIKTNLDQGAKDAGKASQSMASEVQKGTGKVATNTDADMKKANKAVQQSATDMYNGAKTSYSKMADVARSEGSRMYNGVSTSASKMAQSAKRSASDMYRGVTTSTRAMANAAISDWNRIRNAYSRSITGTITKVTVSKSVGKAIKPKLANITKMDEPTLLTNTLSEVPQARNFNVINPFFTIDKVKGTSLINQNTVKQESDVLPKNLLNKLVNLITEIKDDKKPIEIKVYLDKKVIIDASTDGIDTNLARNKSRNNKIRGGAIIVN